MKKTLNNPISFLVGLVFTLLFISCEDVIDVHVESGGPFLSIDAIVTNSTDSQFVKITQSIPYFGNAQDAVGINVDSVVVTDLSGKRFFFSSTLPGIYSFVPNPITGDTFELGNTYSLRVYRGEDIYSAQSTMKRATQVDSITTTFTDGQGGFGGSTPGYFIFINAVDLPGEGDCYWMRTYKNGRFLNAPSQINPIFDASNPGAASDGLPFIFPIAFLAVNDFGNPYQLGDKVKVEILGISRNFYEYLVLASEQLQNGGLFATPPVNLRTNISKNRESATPPVGFFNVCEMNTFEIEIQE